MPIVAKYLNKDTLDTVEVKHFDIEDLISSPNYNNYIYLSITCMRLLDLNIKFPENLQILICHNNHIWDVLTSHPLPTTLRSLCARNNRIRKFPNIESCPHLEDIDFHDNEIEELDVVIPEHVRTVNLSFNPLRKINYEKISPNVKLNISYCCLRYPPPESHKHNIDDDHNSYILAVYPAVQQQQQQAFPLKTTPYKPQIEKLTFVNDNQNVHGSSIQHSTNKSLNYVINYKPKRFTSNIPGIILKKYRDYKSNEHKKYKNPLKKLGSYITNLICPTISLPIDTWCNSTDIHSQHGVTYKKLLEQVWLIIQDHEHREELEKVLFTELEASKNVCFTGRFTRTLNALSGFVETVTVTISDKEQMQNQIAMAVKNNRKKYSENRDEFVKEASKEVKSILDSFNVEEAEKEVWLCAID